MANDLVSIVMQSHNNGKYVAESVRSVIAQTYKNWELLFVDDFSTDDTIRQMMDLMAEGKWKKEDGTIINRVQVTQTTANWGTSKARSSSLRDASGRWIAFLDAGDIWDYDKLEKQIRFMEKNDYAFSYTKYRLIDKNSKERGIVIGGKEHINYQEMKKCCWPGYLTVMYDAEKVGKMNFKSMKADNDYALWLDLCEKTDCHLLDECLASQRSYHYYFNPFPIHDKFFWRYEVFRKSEDMNPFAAFFMAVRSLLGGLVKKTKYVEKLR